MDAGLAAAKRAKCAAGGMPESREWDGLGEPETAATGERSMGRAEFT